jgi:Arylsulfotransferase (ASST)
MFIFAILGCREGEPTHSGPIATVDEDHPNVVHVAWETNDPASSWVEFGLDEGLGQQSRPDSAVTAHQQLMLGLKSGRTYYWRVADEVDGQVTYSAIETVDIPPQAPELPVMTVSVSAEGSTMEGKYLVVSGASIADVAYNPDTLFYVGIIDHDGDFVWYHILPTGSGTNGAYPWSDGQSLWWLEVPIIRQETDGTIRRITLDGTEVASSLGVTAHHAAVEIEGERVAHLGRRFFPDGQGGASSTDRVLVVNDADPEGASSTQLFDYFDDWWQGDPTGWLGECEEVWESAFGYSPNCELTHSNSLGYLASENALFPFARIPNTLLKVDASSGELQWVMGGPQSDFEFQAANGTMIANELWNGPHFSQVWSGGMMVFDNGLNATPMVSSLLEVSWDEDAKIVYEVWRFPEPNDGFTVSLGDALKLQDGHYLGSWMSLGRIDEVTPDREVVWEVTADAAFRRIHVLTDLYDLNQTFLYTGE